MLLVKQKLIPYLIPFIQYNKLGSENPSIYNHSKLIITKDTIYKIRNHACLIIVYNHPTSLRQDQSVAVATTNFA